MADDNKKEDPWDGLKDFLTKAEKSIQEQKEREEKAKKAGKAGKVVGTILKWYVIISVTIITLLLIALLGKGLYEVFRALMHGLSATFA